ncbi:MAG: Yip1 family protein [Betaproteobacteria bacterium]
MARGIIARVKNIILSPSTEWPVIAAEPSSTSAIYLRYVAPLVAIGVIATFIGHTLVGTSAGPLGMIRVGVFAGLAHAILMFGLSFVQVFLIAWLVDVLAPTFGGQRDSLAALKVTAYSFTPGWVAAVLNVIPMLGLLGILAALYGLYLLYLGLPVLMRSPKEKSLGYTVVLVICAVVLSVVVTMLSTCVIAGMGVVGMGALSRNGGVSDAVTSKADSSAVLANVFGAKTDAERERVTQAMKSLEKMGDADKANPPAAAASTAAAMNAVGQIMTGGKDIQPVDFHELRAMLPASLPGMQRTEATGQSGEAMGVKGSSAMARYSDGAKARIRIEIVDLGSMSGLAAMAGKFDPNMEKETATGYERTRRVDGQLVHERYDRGAKSGEVGVLVASRFNVTVEGSGVDAAALTNALKSIDLSSIAAMTTAKK